LRRLWEVLSMNFIESMLMESLRNRNPQLDLQGTDRRVLEIADEDLMNFLRVHWQLTGTESAEYELIEKLYQYHREEPKELEEFVNVWSGMWIKKWNERVKLLFGQEEESSNWQKVSKKICDAEPVWKTLPNRHGVEDVVVESLNKNGEICGTSILAENLIKMEIGSSEKIDVNKDEDVLNLVNGTLRRARNLSRSKGPLIFVRLDKRFFQLSP
jgi:hypothetical protein